MIATIVICISFFMVTQLFNTRETTVPEVVDDRPSVEEFIGSIAETARKLGADNDLYASVMIAQAILESEQGQGDDECQIGMNKLHLITIYLG